MDKPSLLVHEIEFTAAAGAVPPPPIAFAASGSNTTDLSLTRLKPMMGGPVRWSGSNIHGEIGNLTSLAMVSTDTPDGRPLSIPPGSSKTVYFITAIVTSLNSTDPLTDASAIYHAAMAGKAGLLAAHEGSWAARWESGSLEVEGDLFLGQALNSSLYAIRSSIRPDWPYGLSPGGLASNAYEGHTFW